MEITDVVGLKEPLTKLFETVSCGVGKVYEPIHIVRMAKARAKEIRLISEAVSDNINIPINYDNGNIDISTKDTELLLQRAQTRFLYQEMKKQQNIESVVCKAYENLQNVTSVSNTPVDDDWINTFFDSVANVSNEQMQIIWSKILSGEVENPGRFSLRTLNILKMLTQSDALNIENLSQFSVNIKNNQVIILDDDILAEFRITYSKLLYLEDLGIIQMNIGMKLTITVNENYDSMNDDNLKIAFYSKDQLEHKIEIPIIKFTSVGNEIVSIFSSDKNVEYIKKVLLKFREKWNKNNVCVRLNKVEENEEPTMQHQDILNED